MADEDIWVAVLELAAEDIWRMRIFLGLAGDDIWRMRIFGWQF